MSKLTINSFIDTHTAGYCFYFNFPEYRLAKKRNKGRTLTLKGGKILPSPNSVVATAAKKLTGDYALQSMFGGASQKLTVASLDDAKRLLASYSWTKHSPAPEVACKTQHATTFDMNAHLDWARKLQLI